jgi:hypothetical protein
MGCARPLFDVPIAGHIRKEVMPTEPGSHREFGRVVQPAAGEISAVASKSSW